MSSLFFRIFTLSAVIGLTSYSAWVTEGFAQGNGCGPHMTEVSRYVTASRDRPTPQRDRKDYYEILRPLLIYLTDFAPQASWFDPLQTRSLLEALWVMKPNQKIVEFGSGDGHALEEIFLSEADFYQAVKSSECQENAMREGVIRYYVKNYGPLGKVTDDPTLDSKTKKIYDELLEMVLEYVRRPRSQKPRAIGIAYDMHREVAGIPNLKFVKDRLFEEIPDAEFALAIGDFDLGIDYGGIATYTRNLNLYLSRIFRHLNVGGHHFIMGGRNTIRVPIGIQTELPMNLCEWLQRSVEGIRAYCSSASQGIVIERISNKVVFHGLSETYFEDGRPPVHEYLELEKEYRFFR